MGETSVESPCTGRNREDKKAILGESKEDKENNIVMELGDGRVDWSPLAMLLKTRPEVLGVGTKRYSPAEWRRKHEEYMNNAMDLVKLEHDSHCVIDNVTSKTDKEQLESTLRLRLRARKIFYILAKIERHAEATREEILLLESMRQRLRRAITETMKPEAINNESISLRRKRAVPETIRDEVEEELLQERGLIIEVFRVYDITMAELMSQLKSNRDSLQQIESQWSEKTENYQLEVKAAGRRNRSAAIAFFPGSIRHDDSEASYQTWDEMVKRTMDRGNLMLEQSTNLRNRIHGVILEQAVRDLQTQRDKVDLALKRRILEEEISLRDLEKAYDQTLKDIAKFEGITNMLYGYTRQHDYPMKVAQTRMFLRNHRPKAEQTRDDPERGLIHEVHLLSDQNAALGAHNQQVLTTLDNLSKARKVLMDAINEKRHSLQIERRVLDMRESWPSVIYLLGR